MNMLRGVYLAVVLKSFRYIYWDYLDLRVLCILKQEALRLWVLCMKFQQSPATELRMSEIFEEKIGFLRVLQYVRNAWLFNLWFWN